MSGFRRFPVFLLLLGLSATSYASEGQKKYAIVIGGVEEPPAAQASRFDSMYLDFTSFASAAGYETHAAFGSSSALPALKQKEPPLSEHLPASDTSAQKLISDLIARIDRKDSPFHPGDEILVDIAAHGKPAHENEKVSHPIYLGQSQLLLLDQLEALRAAVGRHHLKLAIIDLSCYSGYSLNLRDANTCVLASADPRNTSFDRDNDKLIRQFRPGISLEQAFLSGRKNFEFPEDPQISTPAGIHTMELLSPLESRLVNNSNDLSDELSSVGDPVGTGACIQPPVNPSMNQIELQFSDLRRLAAVPMGQDWPKMLASVQRYDQTLAPIEALAYATHLQGSKKVGSSDLTWSELADLNGAVPTKDPVLAKQIAELSHSPEYQQYLANAKKLATQIASLTPLANSLFRASGDVSKFEQELYPELYSTFSSKAPNPCSDFKL